MVSRKQRRGRNYGALVVGVAAPVVIAAGLFISFSSPSAVFSRSATSTPIVDSVIPSQPKVAHVSAPEGVKAIYMSQCAAGTPSFRADLMHLIETTELNAIVIDIRDYTGKISFPVQDPTLAPYISDECGAPDVKDFIKELHDKNIYVIGRITVFQNPAYAKDHPEQAVQRVGGGVWKDKKGLAFVDVGARAYWDTVVVLSKESYEVGFDELNYDYIRFPSDGDMKAAVYSHSLGKSKGEALEEFYKYLYESVHPTGAMMSADLFGYTTVHEDDLGIGQLLERALPYFDFVAPMVYPSHYNNGFAGLANVNSDPHKVVYASMIEAVRRTVSTTTPIESFAYERIGTSTPAVYAKPSYSAQKMRPWLQDFDYPVEYTPAMVRAQIKANEDAGLTSYMFWDPANKYSSLRQIVAPE